MRKTVAAAALAVAAMTGAAALPTQAGVAIPLAPGISPPGANDFGCRPSLARPHPVVLVHGTFEDMTESWNLISPALKQQGYCVFALDYGQRGTAPIEESAKQLGAFVDRVLAATHAAKVLVVGHSQGGMMPRYWMRFLGGVSKVAGLVGLVPSNHGTTNPGAPLVGALACPSCIEQEWQSPFIQHLNAGFETYPQVGYTVVTTTHDEVVTPYTSALLSGRSVTNVVLQDDCALDPTEHVGIQYDVAALQWVENALARNGRADPSFTPTCLP
jgi:pimeloyl-ACP methyl ester carboxylesterase